MTETADDEVPAHATPPADPPDYILQHLVSLANDTGIGPDVTLFVRGLVVCGIIVPATAFITHLSEMMGQGVTKALKGQDGAEATGKLLAEQLASYNSIYDNEVSMLQTGYIHLQDAKVFFPGKPAMPGNGLAYWRGRLCDVSGFTFGGLK